jgi:hypothetical protein
MEFEEGNHFADYCDRAAPVLLPLLLPVLETKCPRFPRPHFHHEFPFRLFEFQRYASPAVAGYLAWRKTAKSIYNRLLSIGSEGTLRL